MPSLSFANVLQPGWELLKGLALVKPKDPKLSVGLDIGSTAIKVVAMGRRKALGARSVLGSQMVELGETSETNPSEAIKQAVNALGIPVKAVNLSVSGQWVIMRVVEMTAVTPSELAQALPFEAQRYLPFNIQEVVLDGVMLGPTAEGNKIWVLIVACKRDLLERRIDWIRRAGLEPAVIDVDALAVANAFEEHANGRKLTGTHALINVGAQSTNLVIVKDRMPYLVRDIPWGADKLCRYMAEQLGLEEAAVSSQLKQSAPLSTQLLDAMKTVCESLATDLQLSFDFFESHFGPPPDQVLLSGGMGQSAGFLDALKSHLPHPLVSWAPGTGLSSQFAVAYGLALRAPS